MQKSYTLVSGNNYMTAHVALQNHFRKRECALQPSFSVDGGYLARPLTFKETIEARIYDYEREFDSMGNKRTINERLTLFQVGKIDTCSAIIWSRRENKAKIASISKELILMDGTEENVCVGLDIGSFYHRVDGIELKEIRDESDPCGWDPLPLIKAEIIKNRFWLTVLEEDQKLLEAYANIVFSATDRNHPNADEINMQKKGLWPDEINRQMGFYAPFNLSYMPKRLAGRIVPLSLKADATTWFAGYGDIEYATTFVMITA